MEEEPELSRSSIPKNYLPTVYRNSPQEWEELLRQQKEDYSQFEQIRAFAGLGLNDESSEDDGDSLDAEQKSISTTPLGVSPSRGNVVKQETRM